MKHARPIHPFPARMAPDVASESLAHLPEGSRVIDPMCGSGSVLRACVERGLECVGVDIDPLSVLMSRVWTSRLDATELGRSAERHVTQAKGLSESDARPTGNEETRRFLGYWFAPMQQDQLKRLVAALDLGTDQLIRDALSIALSRLIVTKDRGASLARDVSHSRPHRAWLENEFDVYGSFVTSARQVGSRLRPDLIEGSGTVMLGDARHLNDAADNSFDAAVTSPPYLNAIDYMRGHRMTLVWLGYDVADLRAIRSSSIGSERMLAANEFEVEDYIERPPDCRLSERHVGWVRRYAQDLRLALSELARVVKPGGRITLVVGNSVIRGASVDNAALVEAVSGSLGLTFVERKDRDIPPSRRYLPPPTDGEGFLNARMRRETVLTLECA